MFFREDLHRAIEFLCESEKYKLDYILVETNGLADPSNVRIIFSKILYRKALHILATINYIILY